MPSTTDWLSDEDYHYVYSRSPRFCIDLLIVQPAGILLSKRAIEPFLGTWHFPGGRVHYRETISDAVSRIARQEIGVSIENPLLAGYAEVPNDGPYVHSVSMIFKTQLQSTELKGDRQTSELRFFTELPENTHPAHITFLRNNWDQLLQNSRS